MFFLIAVIVFKLFIDSSYFNATYNFGKSSFFLYFQLFCILKVFLNYFDKFKELKTA